jgi:glutathione S-transferase
MAETPPNDTTLLISSKNYSSWSLRGWLLLRLSGLPFNERAVDPDDPTVRDELLLRASSIRVPCLRHDGVEVWDTLAIAEYLNELRPRAQMLPKDRAARARCRSISGEMHSGFEALRSSLPMNLRAHRPGFVVWSAARADIERICTIWRECLATWHGPWLFGERRSVADAMYAPVATRFLTYDVKLDEACASYCARTMAQPDMQEWAAAAVREVDELPDLEVEF